LNVVVAVFSLDDVVSGTTEDGVVAAAAANEIIASKSKHGIGAGRPDEAIYS